MICDIIIPIWNQLDATRECIENIFKNTRASYRLILIDNASDDETRAYLEALKAGGRAPVELIRNDGNLGFVKAVNQGLRISDAPYVCVMNNDTVPAPGWLDNMIDFLERHPDAGLANPQCDGHGNASIEEHADRLAALRDVYMEMNQCFGFCMLIRRAVIEKIGYLDEAFGMGNYDDTDYSMRSGLAGYRCVNVHSAYVYHKKHVSFKASGNRESLVSKGAGEFFKKWPRHLRIGLAFCMDDTAGDDEIEHMLRGILFLAREWCWVNLWIFGEKKICRRKILEISEKIGMPLHQNLKFNYIAGKAFVGVNILVRLIERSFGTKRRKKYDAVILDHRAPSTMLKLFFPIHTTKIYNVDFRRDAADYFGDMISHIRQRR